MDDHFRRFFGFPSNHDRFFDPNTRVPGFRNPIWEDDDDELEDFAHGHPRDQPFGFNVFTGDPFQMHAFFEREMNDVMRSFQEMFQGPLGSFGGDLPQLPGPDFKNQLQEPQAASPNPRDRYLKPSVKRSEPKGDSDIDGRVANGDVAELFGDGNDLRVVEPPRTHHFFGQSVISKSVRGPDGRVEHHKTFTRSDGTKEETITRQIGDQTYSITTKTNVDGTTEKNEEFINMDEGNLSDFESKWFSGNNVRSIMEPRFDSRTAVLPRQEERTSQGGGWFSNIFGKWFS